MGNPCRALLGRILCRESTSASHQERKPECEESGRNRERTHNSGPAHLPKEEQRCIFASHRAGEQTISSPTCKGLSMLLRRFLAAAVLVAPAVLVQSTWAEDFHAITPNENGKTIVLTGHDLTIEDVVAVARQGAQVRYSPEAIKRAADGYDLR